MPRPTEMISVPLPVVPVARSTIAPPTEPRPDLPRPFKPRSVDVTREDVLRAHNVEPFILLPRILIPIPSALWKPPVMHYGWPAPRQRLLAYAEEHKITKMQSRRNPKVFADETDVESESSTDEEPEDSDDSDDSNDSSSSSEGDKGSDCSRTVVAAKATKTRKPCPPVNPSRKNGVDQPATMTAAVRHIRTRLGEERGMQFPSRVMQVCPTLQHCGGEYQIVSVYTNYHFLRKDLPQPEHIKALGEAMGFDTPPKWYIDEEQCEWRSINNPYRR